LKKVCYKVSLCEYCQQQSCNAFTGLSTCARMVREGRTLLKIWWKLTHPIQKKADFQFSSVQFSDF